MRELSLIDALKKFLRAHRKFRCARCREVFPACDPRATGGSGSHCCFCAGWSATTTGPLPTPPATGSEGTMSATPRGEAPRGEAPGGFIPPSPWVYSVADINGRVISITIPYNQQTLALQNGTVHKDPGCQWNRIYIGLGTDGTVETSIRNYAIPDGDTTITAGQLGANGLNTWNDLRQYQVTAGN